MDRQSAGKQHEQPQQPKDRHSRNNQGQIQNIIQSEEAAQYQNFRSQQSPSTNPNVMPSQQQRTTRIFLPHQTTVKNHHQRQSSNGGVGGPSSLNNVKGVSFQKNARPGQFKKASGDFQEQNSREEIYDFAGYVPTNQMDTFLGDQPSVYLQQNLQGDNLTDDNQADVGNGHEFNEEEADVSVSVSVSMKQRMQKPSSKGRQEDYTFSPRDGQANSKHRILQPNFKKRTPSGTNQIQNINKQQMISQGGSGNQGVMQQQLDSERMRIRSQQQDSGRMMTPSANTSGVSPKKNLDQQCLSMSPPIKQIEQVDHPIQRLGGTEDSAVEDFAVDNEEGEAEMSSVNHNTKQSLVESHGLANEGRVYPRMFAGKFKGQKGQQQNNTSKGRVRGADDKFGNSPFGARSNDRSLKEYDDAHDEPTSSALFLADDHEENNAEIQLPYSQTSSPNVNSDQRYKGSNPPKRPSKLSTSKNVDKKTGRKEMGGAHQNSMGKTSQGGYGDKFSLNLQGVQDKQTKMRKILSMRDPVSAGQEREGAEDEDENSENVLDNALSQGDFEGAQRTYSKQDKTRVRIASVQSPNDHPGSKRTKNDYGGRDSNSNVNSGDTRSKHSVRSSQKNPFKSKSSNRMKVQSKDKGSHNQQKGYQNDLDNQNPNMIQNSNFQVRGKSGNRAYLNQERMAQGSQSARGPQNNFVRGLSQSKLSPNFQSQNFMQNAQPIQNHSNSSRKNFNHTQKMTLKGSSSQNLTTKQPQQKGWLKNVNDENSDNAEYNFIDQLETDGRTYDEGEMNSGGKIDGQGLMEMPKTNQLMSQRNRISNISSSKGGREQKYPQVIKEIQEQLTPSTLMPQQMKISPSKRKHNNPNNNQVVMMMHHQSSTAGSGSAGASTGMTDDRMRRKTRGQQEQGNPKQTSEKYNFYNNPIQNVQASQVFMPDQNEQMEQDEDLGQEFVSPYSQYPNQQQKPRKSSVRLSNPDEERQEIKNQNMYNMIPSASHDFQSKMSHYNRPPINRQPQVFGKTVHFQTQQIKNARRGQQKMPQSIFDQFKEASTETQSSYQLTQKQSFNEHSQDPSSSGGSSYKFFHFSEQRINKLYDEIYSDDSGSFFGFFSNNDKNKRDQRKLESYYASTENQRGRDRMSPQNMSETDFGSNINFNTYRDAQYHKEEYLKQKRQRNKKMTNKDQQQLQNDPLFLLWQELQDQDDELIFSESCQIVTDNYSNANRITSMSNLYASGIESSRAITNDNSLKQRGGGGLERLDSYNNRDDMPMYRPFAGQKPKIIPYDFHVDVHQQAHEFSINVTNGENMVHFFVCYQKRRCLQEFLKAKHKQVSYFEDLYKFSLRNSIIPAIQGHILILMDVPARYKDKLMSTALSSRNVLSHYHKSCRTVQNWLQSVDFGPLEQHADLDHYTHEREDVAGACLSPSVSTKEFYDLKLYQVDEELPDQINTLFNPISTMYYVDKMGNLLQSIKQSFYEKSDDKSYISKMFSSDNHSAARENLCKSYDVIREIYESMLQPSRQHQLRHVNRLYQQDIKDARNIQMRIKDGFNYEELGNVSYLNIDMHSDKSPTGLSFFDYYSHSILDVSFFTMTTHQYNKVLLGLPEYDKNLGDNTQVLLKAKIDILKKSLVKSVNEHEFELVYYIRFLKSQRYNCNVFGKFNPITVNEEEIIEQMAKRR